LRICARIKKSSSEDNLVQIIPSIKGGFQMNRTIKIIVISAFLLVFVANSFGQRRGNQPVEFKKISDRLYELLGGRGARGGVYIGDNGALIIDAKMDKQSVDQVIKGIGQITDKPIKYLVSTHSDGDHISGNRYFPTTTTFIAHENCRKEYFQPRPKWKPIRMEKTRISTFRSFNNIS